MNICVYGAASDSIDRTFIEAGERLGEEMAKRGHNLIFGGGGGGLMGAVARGVHRQGGVKITGIVPDFFTEDGKHVDGLLFQHIDEYIETDHMRERKKLLDEMADAFIISPGGIGTYDELFEMLTLKNLGQHKKVMAVLNTNGYYDSLLAVLESGIKAGFIKEKVMGLLFVSEDINEILDHIEKNA
ncbi:MAG: TIGR00730 family Rossman fold protein [Clostridia bacterium]|nr:TIGR00730 family Rossman fold protein [Clostridia bacterium]